MGTWPLPPGSGSGYPPALWRAAAAAWTIAGIFSFEWLPRLSYAFYVAIFCGLLALLALMVLISVWVGSCFREHKFPVVWPVKVLQLMSRLLFQTFDVASLNLLEVGISCRFTGRAEPHLYLDFFPTHSCSKPPQLTITLMSSTFLVLYVVLGLFIKLAQVEVNPLCKRPLAMGNSYVEVTAFVLKVLLTLVHVFIGYPRVEACLYLVLSLAFAWQYLRWSPHLVNWVNYLRSGVAATVVWCSATLALLVFHPGLKQHDVEDWADRMTVLMAAGLGPAFIAGALMSYGVLRRMTVETLKAVENSKSEGMLADVAEHVDDPRDIEIVARCCRVWRDSSTLDPEAIKRAQKVIQAGLAMFPSSASLVLLQGNFLVDVLGVKQAGSRRIEDARKLDLSLMCRYIMFVRRQQAAQHATDNSNTSGGLAMDLLSYVEYQRKYHMVLRLHREALQATCSFWKALDAPEVSFTRLSHLLNKIEDSVARAQAAYKVVLGTYGQQSRLVRLYGKFLQALRNDPWHAAEYEAEADRLDEAQQGTGGPSLADGTPLGRMDEMASAVLVINSAGEVKVANKNACVLFGYKRAALEGKPMTALVAPQHSRWLMERLAVLVRSTALDAGSNGCALDEAAAATAAGTLGEEATVVGLHSDKLAFPIKLSIRKASGVGEDSTFIAVMEAVPPVGGTASLWVAMTGTIVACDPQFVMAFGWRPHEVTGVSIAALISLTSPATRLSSSCGLQPAGRVAKPAAVGAAKSASETLKRLAAEVRSAAAFAQETNTDALGAGCWVRHKYSHRPCRCTASLNESGDEGVILHEIRLQLENESEAEQLMVINRGSVVHASADLLTSLYDVDGAMLLAAAHGVNGQGGSGGVYGPGGGLGPAGAAARVSAHDSPAFGFGLGLPIGDHLASSTLGDFLPPPWKEAHTMFLKGSMAGSSAGSSPWSCRKAALPGPTLELRSTSGKPLYMRVSVSTADVAGEPHHVIRLARSSLESALAERRLRLQLNADGLIMAVSEDTPAHLFAFQPQKLVGRHLLDVVDWSPRHSRDGAKSSVSAPRCFNDLLSRAAVSPGHSWRVHLKPPPVRVNMGHGREIPDLFAALGAAVARPAVLQVAVPRTPDADGGGYEGGAVVVELWPLASITGVLELDPYGRIHAVLEEHLRPAGLLFGVATPSLVGCSLDELVALPLDCSRTADLLAPSGAKKSSMKAQAVATHVKVGPLHILQATHSDARDNTLSVQVVGRPGPKQPLHVILRTYLPTNTLQSVSKTAVVSRSGAAMVVPPSVAARATTRCATATPPPAATTEPSPAARAPASRCLTPPAAPRATNLQQPAAAVEAGAAIRKVSTPDTPEAVTKPLSKRDSGIQQPIKTAAAAPAAAAAATAAAAAVARTDQPRSLHPDVRIPPELSGAEGEELLDDSAAVLPFSGSGMAAPAAPEPAPEVSLPLDLATMTDLQQGGVEGACCDGYDDSGLLSKPAFLSKLAASQSLLAGRAKLADLVVKSSTGGGGGGGAGPRSRGPAGRTLEGGGGGGSRSIAPQTGELLRLHDGEQQWRGVSGGAEVDAAPQALPWTPTGSGARGGRQAMKPMADPRVIRTATCGSQAPPPTSAVATSAALPTSTETPNNNSDGDGGRSDGGTVQCKVPHGSERVSTWVESSGVFYQNSAAVDDAEDALLTTGSVGSSSKAPSEQQPAGASIDDRPDPASVRDSVSVAVQPRTAGGIGHGLAPAGAKAAAGHLDEDAASEAGESVQSCLTGDAMEFKRGKRYQKLLKMIDATPSQRCSASCTHVICFALTMSALHSKRVSMVQLGRSGLIPRFTGQVTADVRSLDLISRNKTLPTLYTWDDAQYYVARVSDAADEVKMRMEEVITIHGAAGSAITELLFATHRTVWHGNAEDGSDIYDNLTVWDFFTRFVTFSKEVKQHADEWLASGVPIADTTAGQFIIKSGPDLWRTSRKVLDALLYVAVDDARSVDQLQIIFLTVEGVAVTLLAAGYLAYLLKGLAAQRYQLYEALVLIPVGLTRTQAAQSTALDEDDEDDEDEEEQQVDRLQQQQQLLQDDVGEGSDNGAVEASIKQKGRRGSPSVDSPLAQQRQQALSTAGRRRVNASFFVPPAAAPGDASNLSKTSRLDVQKGLKERPQLASVVAAAVVQAQSSPRRGCFGRLLSYLGRVVSSRQQRATIILGGVSTPGKRKLLRDTYDVALLLLPFIIWAVVVITIYAIAVSRMTNIVHVVAVHSVANFIAARINRAELVALQDPTQLPTKRAAVATVWKVVRDAWYTVQLGLGAVEALGPDTENFAMVKEGLAHASPKLEKLFFYSGNCHRLEKSGPCPGPGHRHQIITHTGVDTMMQRFLMHIRAMAVSSSTTPPLLTDGHFDYIYNVGYTDLIDGATRIQEAHLDIILGMFNDLFTLHVLLFVLFWIVFTGFFGLLLDPLLKRISRERRRIAGLLSQLPLELDVERLVARALGTGGGVAAAPAAVAAGSSITYAQ
ncbi:hypothetical protein PLESTB_001081300 [Pleodorina starrii]|uniref:PAS domain-containing protein n=1 Tax=Pleodorina starrii TaxID=330485 RepID=A0A9W6BQ69_9CHLO|nr:hypothetical protein PLESTB_001081300 [Pleodorina starrii]